MSTRQVQGTAGGRKPLFQGLGDIKKERTHSPWYMVRYIHHASFAEAAGRGVGH